MPLVVLDMVRESVFAENQVRNAFEHGLELSDCQAVRVAGNVVWEPGWDTANTFDGIILTGDTDGCLVSGNLVVPASASTRYGINVSVSTCDDNVIDGNFLGETAAYGTGSFNDAGTGTITARDGNGQFTY